MIVTKNQNKRDTMVSPESGPQEGHRPDLALREINKPYILHWNSGSGILKKLHQIKWLLQTHKPCLCLKLIF